MKRVLSVMIVLFLCVGSTFAQEKGKKVVEANATTIEATRGADPNVKTERSTVDEPVAEDESTRGGYCAVIIDNWTGYAIDIYVDGDYKGTIPAWEKQQTYAIAGETKLYGKSTGGTYTWGPSYVDCIDEFTWKLNP